MIKRKIRCKLFGCKIIQYTKPGCLHAECIWCGWVLHLSHEQPQFKLNVLKWLMRDL